VRGHGIFGKRIVLGAELHLHKPQFPTPQHDTVEFPSSAAPVPGQNLPALRDEHRFGLILCLGAGINRPSALPRRSRNGQARACISQVAGVPNAGETQPRSFRSLRRADLP